MAKASTLKERYVSEADRKLNQKRSTRMICIIITIMAIYMFGYIGHLKGINDFKSQGLLQLLDEVESRLSAHKYIYPISASVLKGWLLALAVGGFAYFVISLDNERHQVTNMERSHGTGGFMKQEQKKEYDALYKMPDPKPITDYEKVNPANQKWEDIEHLYSGNMINSMNFTRPMNSRTLIGNNNTLVVGGAGTGKSRFVIKPNVLQMNASYIITDPSGEMIASLGNVLIKNGYKLKIFNISNKRYSNTYNPIKYIRTEEDVNILITCLIDNTTKGEGGGDNQFFVDAEKLLYSACIFYLVDFCTDESKKNFAGVMDLIISSNVDEKNAEAKSDLDKLFDALPKSSLASKYYRSFKQAAGKTLKSIIISCVTRLQPFLIPQIINLTKTDELELDKIGNERTALFIITPQADRTYAFLASILYSQLFMTLYSVAEQRKATIGDERLPIPVRCMMDEFANIGTVPAFDEKLATMRKYNISATVVLQNLSQIEATYEDKWRTIVGNCSTIIFLGSPEKENLEYFSDLLGEETIRVKSTSTSDGKGGGSKSYQYESRKVMTPDEIGVLPSDECLVFTQNFRPVRDYKYKYEQHPYYPQTGDCNASNNFSYTKVSAFDNANSFKYESILVASSILKKHKKKEKIKMQKASEVAVEKPKTKDEVLNEQVNDTEQASNIKLHYKNSYLNQIFDLEGTYYFAKVDGMPTKMLDDMYNTLVKETKFRNIVIFVGLQSNKDILLGCVNNEIHNEILENDNYVLQKKQLDDGNWLFMIPKAYYEDFKAYVNK